MPRTSITLTVEEVQYVAWRLAKELMEFDEPIPDFTTRFPGKLESCLAQPFQKFARKSLYPTITRRAAVLLYLMVKNHPFQNGNKRLAMTSLFVFLYKHKKWLKVDTKELYNFTLWVAESPASLKDDVVNAADRFIRSHMVDFSSR